MSGVFSDQAFVDLLIERIEGKFVYVPAWRKWFQDVEGYWREYGAEEDLKTEYRRTVEAERGEEISNTSRRKAINAVSQQAALWLLRMDPRMLSSPERVALRLKRPGSDSLSMRTHESLGAMEKLGGLEPGTLETWLRLMRTHAKSIPNILIRTDHQAPNPDQLWGAAMEWLGDQAVRLPLWYWQHGVLTAHAAYLLSGATLVFLDGLMPTQTGPRFPQWPLYELASHETRTWFGKDGSLNELVLPSHWIVCGPPVELKWLELDIKGRLLSLSSLTKETSR